MTNWQRDWCPLRGSSSTDRGLPTTAGRLPSFPQSFPECFAATCPFKTSHPPPLASCKHCNFSTAVQKAKSAKTCKQTCSLNSLRSNKAMWALRRWNEEWEEGGVVTQGGQQAQAVLSQPCQSFQGSASTDPSIIFFD